MRSIHIPTDRESMKHWSVTGPRRLELAEVDTPIPGSGDVLIRVFYTALSPGSNLHVYRTGTYATTWTPGRVDALYMGSGVIEAVGSDVDPGRIGERVAFNGLGHQEYGVLPSTLAHRVPEGVGLDVASLAYLSAWSVSALHLGQYAAAETVAVVGLGLVGSSAALTANAMGARVLALDIDAERLALASRFGLSAVGSPVGIGDDETPRSFLDDGGADLIIETSGSWSGFRTAMKLARDYSRIALMGIYRDPPPEDLRQVLHNDVFGFPSKMHYQRIQIIGCGSDPESLSEPMPRSATRGKNLRWVLEQAGRGRLDLGSLVTSIVPAEAIGSVLTRLDSGDASQIGVVFDWGVES